MREHEKPPEKSRVEPADQDRAGGIRQDGAKTGVKTAIDRWKTEGDREDQDYDHIPGSRERDHAEIHASSRDRKSRKS
ncbi:MAG TPA: hypothetical protein VMW05_05200 [Methyloceanibacter sp.]|nr:hypothetical protein [Methyloceanibacter sp.]